ncbi:MAG TPA: DUF6544 family protein [Micromonosporaceae bacterium]
MATIWDVQDTSVSAVRVFRLDALHDVPAPAAAYLTRAIEPGARLPRGVRLTMHGQIKLGAWLPFIAEETIEDGCRFRWSARVAGGLFSGSDELRGRLAESRFELFGRVPVVTQSGSDVRRSAVGRFLAEQAVWLPGNLLPDAGARWHVDRAGRAVVMVPHHGRYGRVTLSVQVDGRLRDISVSRWGRDAGQFGWIPFGMVAEEERTFGDFTVPSAGRAGWWYGTKRWPAGEFFRFTIDDYAAL